MSLIRILLCHGFRAALAVAGPALLLTTPAAHARDNLARTISSLYGGDGITLAPPTSGFSHAAHFTDEALTELNDLNSSIAATWPRGAQLHGRRLHLRHGARVPVRSSNSFGPILTERAETLGRTAQRRLRIRAGRVQEVPGR